MWSEEEARQLRALKLDPVQDPPEKLVPLVEHFKSGRSTFAVTEGNGPVQVSKGLARKVNDLAAQGMLDWVLNRREPNLSPINETSELKSWIRDHLREASRTVEAYKQELAWQIETVETALGQCNKATVFTDHYGLTEEKIIDSMRSHDHQLTALDEEFHRSLSKGNEDVERAKELAKEIGHRLDNWLAI
jgi:hypothetical protein